MQSGTLMGLITLILMLVFIGIVAWTYLWHKPADFDRVARLPLQEDGPLESAAKRSRS